MTAVDQEIQDTPAAQQLSLVVWKAPHDVDRPCRVTKRALAQVPGHGMVAAAKVDAAVFVTRVTLREIGMLSKEEALLVKRAPHTAAQVKALVDACVAAVLRGYQP